jgi:hypothetical protein
VIVHELLTGRRLFKRETAYDTYQVIVSGKVEAPSEVNPSLDDAIDKVVLKALAYEREDRYPTAEAFGEALIGLLHQRGASVSASDISRFFDRHFTTEIDEHAAQMREVIEGKRRSALTGTWNIQDPDSDPAGEPLDDPLDPAIDPPLPSSETETDPVLAAVRNNSPGDFEDNAETQIELDPVGRFDAVAEAAAAEPAAGAGGGRDSNQVTLPAMQPASAEAPRGGPNRTLSMGAPPSAPSRPAGTPPPAPAAATAAPDARTLYQPPGTPGSATPASPAAGRASSHAEAAVSFRTPAPQAAAGRAASAAAGPGALILAVAFLVSAGVGLGATVLISTLL